MGAEAILLGDETGVLELATRLNVGGPARQILALAKGLRTDLSVHVAAGRPAPHEGELTDETVTVRPVPLVRPIRPGADLRALFAIRKLLVETNPSIVHTHMAKAGAIGRMAALSIRPRPRLVHTFHGHVLSGYFHRPQEQGFLLLERMLARVTDVLVAVSPEIREELLGLGIGTECQYRVIPVGCDLEAFLAVEEKRNALRSFLKLDTQTPLAGVIGRLVPVKDHLTLFMALAKIPDLHLAVLGDGELRAELETKVYRLGIDKRVHFTGWWDDIPSALADLDIVVLSSRNEGTPVSLIEALAAARPVIATDVGGVRNVVQDRETGWLCPPGDVDGLVAVLRFALEHPADCKRMAVEGRRRVSERFSLEITLQEHLALYNELLAR